MSVSQKQLDNYVKTILNDECFEELFTRINTRLFNRFIDGNEAERKVIADIMAAEKLFKKEINAIASYKKEIY